MATPNEFWLALNALAQAYDAEGQTPEERSANTIDEFEDLPSPTRRALLEDVRRLATHLPHLFLAARTRAQLLDEKPLKSADG